MTRAVHLPYTVEQDEDGAWCAHAQLRPAIGAHGEGNSREAASMDLRGALIELIAEFGIPDELTLILDFADMPLEPIASDVEAWFAELDRFADVPPFEDGRNQPPIC
jgi:hypothetical protein